MFFFFYFRQLTLLHFRILFFFFRCCNNIEFIELEMFARQLSSFNSITVSQQITAATTTNTIKLSERNAWFVCIDYRIYFFHNFLLLLFSFVQFILPRPRSLSMCIAQLRLLNARSLYMPFLSKYMYTITICTCGQWIEYEKKNILFFYKNCV